MPTCRYFRICKRLGESIDHVNEIINNGLNAGGVEPIPSLDEGFMFLRTIEDLDGFTWGVMCLDMDKFKASS